MRVLAVAALMLLLCSTLAVAGISCSHCGALNPDSAHHCLVCGRSLGGGTSHSVPSAHEPPPAAHPSPAAEKKSNPAPTPKETEAKPATARESDRASDRNAARQAAREAREAAARKRSARRNRRREKSSSTRSVADFHEPSAIHSDGSPDVTRSDPVAVPSSSPTGPSYVVDTTVVNRARATRNSGPSTGPSTVTRKPTAPVETSTDRGTLVIDFNQNGDAMMASSFSVLIDGIPAGQGQSKGGLLHSGMSRSYHYERSLSPGIHQLHVSLLGVRTDLAERPAQERFRDYRVTIVENKTTPISYSWSGGIQDFSQNNR